MSGSSLRASDPLAELGRIHLIGVGGAGMSALTRMLCARGAPVSGSELRESRILAPLRALGANIHLGQREDSLPEVDTVVVSTAIRDDNAELITARARGLRVLHRAEALAYCMRSRTAVVIAGTHGKTTTTSMLAVALQHCGADPSFYIGAQLNETGTNAHAGSGQIFVAESDESDGSFLVLDPDIAVVTNVEADHLDHWGNAAAVHQAFDDFVERLEPDGLVIACADDPGAAAAASHAHSTGRTVLTYGEHAAADVRVTGLELTAAGSSFEPVIRGRRQPRVMLRVLGRHNVLNATAALTAGIGLGFGVGEMSEGLELYTGARRRFEFKGEADGVKVYDDYAHHHSEIKATLEAARQIAVGGRLIVAFQPLRFTRTAMFHRELGEALGLADEVVVLEVYGSNEAPIPGATGALVAAAVPLPAQQVQFEPSFSAVAPWLVDRAEPGDLVLTLGDGIVTTLGPEVVELLAEREFSSRRGAS
ncbi:MAG TPA: UDP-N-acetylmuramate--L-alanine ligase [Actinomycetes bacterium]|nr:UDP-N-acetylmuramate--L-alanine ligase [Actinomycetes bacterium]